MNKYRLAYSEPIFRNTQAASFKLLFGNRVDKPGATVNFRPEERLTEEELDDVLRWDKFYVSLLSGDRPPTTDRQSEFLLCARGDRVPETVAEWAIVKLLHQVAALRGAYCSEEKSENQSRYFSMVAGAKNDIDRIRKTKLGEETVIGHFLPVLMMEIEHEISEGLRKEEDATIAAQEAEHEATEEENALLNEEVLLNMGTANGDFARSEEEGWFYNDEEDQ